MPWTANLAGSGWAALARIASEASRFAGFALARNVLVPPVMRDQGRRGGFLGGVLLVCAGACAASTPAPVAATGRPGGRFLACQQEGMRVYDYGDHVAVAGLGVEIETGNGWAEADGRHFAVWVRLSDRTPVAIEVVFPKDAPGRAITRFFELGPGRTLDVVAGADGVWRIHSRPTTVAACRTFDPEDQALALWLSGESHDEIAAELGMGSRDAAEKLVGTGLREARQRYQDER